MSRSVLVVTLGLLSLLGTRAACAASPVTPDRIPTDLDTLRSELLGADELVVRQMSLAGAEEELRGAPDRDGSHRRELTDPRERADWTRRFTQALLPAKVKPAPGFCAVPGVLSSPDALPTIGVNWRRGASRGWIRLEFDAACALLQDVPRATVSIDFSGRSPAILALVREALPADLDLEPSEPSLTQDNTIAPWPAPGGQSRNRGESADPDGLPEVIRRVPPEYPPIAREARVSGTVMLKVLVGRNGRVLDARVTKSVPMLDAAAVRCVRQWRFRPATTDGRPVTALLAVPITFSLR